MRYLLWIVLLLSLTSCGRSPLRFRFTEEQLVIRSRATLPVESGDSFRGAMNQSQGVSVTNAPRANMTMDASQFVIPEIRNEMLNFGTLTISALSDNDLKVCGSTGKQKCGTALLRVYTTGVAGPGIYNSADGYGAPLTANLTSPLLVGLGTTGAVVMQTYTIPANRNTVLLADFSPNPQYRFDSDFTNAGAGDYSTTIVIEYALAP